MILEPNKANFVTASTFPPSICHEVMGLGGNEEEIIDQYTQGINE